MSSPTPPPSSAALAAQTGLVTLLGDELKKLWPNFDLTDLNRSLPQLTAVVDGLSKRYGAASTALAAQFYRAQRQSNGVTGRVTMQPAPDPPTAQVKAAVDWATKGLWSKTPDLPAAQTLVEGVTEKLVLDQGRDTIIRTVQHDRAAKAWARVPEPGCCSFCALLSTRGAVYKQETVGFKAHGRCRCHAEPIFTSYEPTAQIREWQAQYAQATRGVRGGGNALLNAWRQSFEGRANDTPEAKTVGGSDLTEVQIRHQLSVLESNLPKLTSENARAFHLQQIAKLKKLLGH